MQRRLAAILAADVVGYARLMGEDEASTLSRLKSHREELIDPLIAEHRGRIVKLMGDGALIEFASVVDAVRCAVEIQRGMTERNADVPDEQRIRFRVGINLGDVIIEGDDIFGDGVNVAARLERLAEPGGICVSRTVRNQVRDKVALAFEDLGEHQVKNIARPIRVFRVITEAGAVHRVSRRMKTMGPLGRTAFVAAGILLIAAAGVGTWLKPWESEPAFQTSPLSARASIAALPFANLSDDPDQEYFSDGITNDIITDLSKFHDLFVIASNSVFVYKGKPVTIEQVGRDLGVRYVLEGSVQRLGNRVRVNTQLIDSTTGRHLWAERYDEDFKDIFDLQDRITREIVRTLAIRVTALERQRGSAKPTSDLQAYDYVLRGRDYVHRLKRAENFEAREMFRRAIELDPGYASAYAGLGWTYLHPVLFGWTGSAAADLARAHELGQKAVALHPASVDGHRLLGNAYSVRRQHDLAIVELERAIALNPNDAQSHIIQGVVLLWSSRPDGAILALEAALRFDPQMAPMALWHLGLAYYLKERYKDAAAVLERAVAERPDFVFSRVVLAATYGQLEQTREAAREAAAIRRLDPFFDIEFFGPQFRDPAHAAHVVEGLRKAGLEGDPAEADGVGAPSPGPKEPQ